jgi:hypothetical protein
MWKRKADISLSATTRTQQVVVRVCFLLFHAIEPEAPTAVRATELMDGEGCIRVEHRDVGGVRDVESDASIRSPGKILE